MMMCAEVGRAVDPWVVTGSRGFEGYQVIESTIMDVREGGEGRGGERPDGAAVRHVTRENDSFGSGPLFVPVLHSSFTHCDEKLPPSSPPPKKKGLLLLLSFKIRAIALMCMFRVFVVES